MQEFASAWTPHPGTAASAFEVQNERFLKINLGGGVVGSTGGRALDFVWIKMGTMVAHVGGGEVKFEREGVLEHGFRHAMKKAFTSEGADLVRAHSKSRAPVSLFLAEQGKSVVLLRLAGDSVVVNGNDLLAFEPTGIKHTITMMRNLSALVSGGLFNVRLEGHGFVAILAHGKPIVLPVSSGHPPVFTDPQATVAWSGSLVSDFHTDVSFKTFIGRSSGESFQMKFVAPQAHNNGFVVVQPYEEVPRPEASKGASSG